MPRFSVIMPAYNRARLIRHAVESVLKQTFTDFELIVVDDGSTDDTVKILKTFGNQLTLLQQTNQGPGAARNRGIQRATGDYLAFLDSDDLYLPWTLDMYDQALTATGEPALLISSALPFSDENELVDLGHMPLEYDFFTDYLQAAEEDFWIGASVVAVQRRAMRETQGFNNAKVNQEDCDMWLRLGNAPGFVVVRQPICSARRHHDQNVSHETERNIRGVQYLIDQYRNKQYPMDKAHRKATLTVLTRHIRPACLNCLAQGEHQAAWSLYRQSFAWHWSLGRVRFLGGFLLKAVLSLMPTRNHAGKRKHV